MVTTADRPCALILDDEKSYTDLLANVLSEFLTCPVATFTRPADALAALPGLEVGIIVTDFYMPEINGLEFLRRAAVIKPGVPAIMITGHSEALASIDHRDITALRTVLGKPFRVAELASEVVRHWPDALRRP